MGSYKCVHFCPVNSGPGLKLQHRNMTWWLWLCRYYKVIDEPIPNMAMPPKSLLFKSQICKVNRGVWERKYPSVISVAVRRKGLCSFQIQRHSLSLVRSPGRNFSQSHSSHSQEQKEMYIFLLVCTQLNFSISIGFRTLCLGMVPPTVSWSPIDRPIPCTQSLIEGLRRWLNG